MRKLLLGLDKTISVILSILVAYLAIGVLLTVFLRYLFGISYGWFEESLTTGFIFITFLGAALSVREHQHIAITYFLDRSTGRKHLILQVLVELIIIVVSLVITIYSIKWIRAVGNTISPASGVMKGVYYSMVTISSLLTILYCILEIVGYFIPIPPCEMGYQNDGVLPEEEQK